jgi:hypothetical protein
MGLSLGGSALFGSKPVVPAWNNVNLGTSQNKAVASNEAALPGAEALTASSNTFNQGQVEQMLNAAMPGYSQIAGNVAGNIESMTAGKIPGDVAGAVQDSAAAQSLTGGFGGSGLSGNLTARDLGLTSLNLTEQGTSSAESWMNLSNSLFAPGQMNVASMFVSPEQQFSADMQNEENSWNTQWLSNQVQAMPNPTSVGTEKFMSSMLGSIMGAI